MSFSGEKTKRIYGAVFGVALHLKRSNYDVIHDTELSCRGHTSLSNVKFKHNLESSLRVCQALKPSLIHWQV